LTYTAAEFERSVEKGRPIFVFIKTEGGSWRNNEPVDPLKTALSQFKNRVLSSGITPAYFETPDQLKVEVVKALVNWNAVGRPGARKTFATVDEYFLKPKANALFDYEQSFFGRIKQSNAFQSFLANDSQVVFVISGRGGIGKSKFLKRIVKTKRVRHIHVLDLSTGVTRQITKGAALPFWGGPVWSPDGRQIAYGTVKENAGRIYASAADGTPGEKLLFEYPVATNPNPTDWSPDGRYLAFASGGVVYAAAVSSYDFGKTVAPKAIEMVRAEYSGFGPLLA
jgi:hypothetical protein